MHYVDRVLAHGDKQRKIPVPKKFWKDFPLGTLVKIVLMSDHSLFYVDKIQAQGKLQRRVPLPIKFWEEFSEGSVVMVEVMRKKK